MEAILKAILVQNTRSRNSEMIVVRLQCSSEFATAWYLSAGSSDFSGLGQQHVLAIIKLIKFVADSLLFF